MAKGAFPWIILLQIIYSAAAQNTTTTSGGGGDAVETACQKSSDASFCVELLKPYASQFIGNDTNKMGFAAISATLAQVQATRAYMVRQTTEPEATAEEREAVTECLGMVGNCDDNLRMASQEFDGMRAATGQQRSSLRDTVVKMIDSARSDQNGCLDLLKSHKDLIAGKVIGEAARLANRSVQACTVAQAFIL